MSSKKTVLIISLSDLSKDPRVNRQIRFLTENYNVVAAGYENPALPEVSFRKIEFTQKGFLRKVVSGIRLLTRSYERQYWNCPTILRALEVLDDVKADLIVANDIETLPLALRISNGSKVIFDAHEYAPREFEDLFVWRLFYQGYKTYLCREYIRQSDAMLTVSSGIAEEYCRNFGVNPIVFSNAGKFFDILPSRSSDAKIRMVWHGLAVPSRNIEVMIQMFEHLDLRFELDLMLVPSCAKYTEKLKTLATKCGAIRFINPVAGSNIVPATNHYDIGLYLLPPTSFNNYHALPNKFFEYIQARLAVAIGPSVEMASIVEKYGCGIVSDDFSPKGMADKLMKLDAKSIASFKCNAGVAAQDLCAENNKELLLRTLETSLFRS